MEFGNPNASAPASPFDGAAMSPVQSLQSQPHSPHSVGSAAGMPAAPPSAVKAPRDDDDEDLASPAEPHASPATAVGSQQGLNDFNVPSPTASSPNRAPTPPDNPSAASAAKLEALNKQIASRTAAADAATKEKEAKIVAAALEYLKALKTKREKEVTAATANHKQQQQAGADKIDEYRKSGAVWNSVGMLVDLQKPNQYSKGTERMRSILTTLNAAPVKK